MKSENKILIIAGPSAVGKTTVAHRILEKNTSFEYVRSVTTRPSRNDTYGAEYIYVDDEGFDRLVASGGLLEYTEYAGFRYGTPISEIDRICKNGKAPLLILDLKGVSSVKSREGKDFSACAVYIYDELDTIDNRLYQRYLSPPVDDGVKKYTSRKNQNILDYSSLPGIAGNFYSFIHNKGTENQTADAITQAFSEFSKGIKADTEKNLSIATELSLCTKSNK